MEYQQGSYTCKTIQLTDISIFMIMIIVLKHLRDCEELLGAGKNVRTRVVRQREAEDELTLRIGPNEQS
jgi:hypothetical protein